MYTMNNIDNRRAIREALAWRGYSYMEAAAEIGCGVDDLVNGRVGLWRVMALVEATDAQMYEWGKK